MEKKFSTLIKVLQDELSTYKDLLKLAEKKTDVLTKGDVELLNKITAIEQESIVKIGNMEKQRFEIIEAIAREYKKDVSEINAEFMGKVLPEDDARKFFEIYEELKKVLKDIDEKNKINEKLIIRALEYIQFTVDLITQSSKEESGYSADGKTRENALNFIDRKA